MIRAVFVNNVLGPFLKVGFRPTRRGLFRIWSGGRSVDGDEVIIPRATGTRQRTGWDSSWTFKGRIRRYGTPQPSVEVSRCGVNSAPVFP